MSTNVRLTIVAISLGIVGLVAGTIEDVRFGHTRASAQAVQSSCAGVRDGVILYEDRDFGGRCAIVRGDNPALTAFNDITSSIRFVGAYAGGWEAELYEHRDYGGRSVVVRGDNPALTSFNDIASSIRIRRLSFFDAETELCTSPSGILSCVDELLKPAEGNAQVFQEAMRNIGRVLNRLGSTRGYVGAMDELGQILSGTAQVLKKITLVLDLNDYRRFFITRELTNADVARTAINRLQPLPVPFLGDFIADWMIKNMLVDPNGYWEGLAPPVE